MVHNERGPAGSQSPILNTQSPNGERGGLPAQAGKESEKGKEKSIVERMGTTVLDIGRDILTANEMAKEKLDGDSALLRVAKGATTTAIGMGLEKVLDETFKKGMEGGKLYFGKLQIDIPPMVADQIKGFEKIHPRIHHFILQSTKDLLTGTIYNGLAFFSRPMLESAKGEHLVGSLAVNATEAMFTRGLDYPVRQAEVDLSRESLNKQKDEQIRLLRDLSKSHTPESKLKRTAVIQEALKIGAQLKSLKDPINKPWAWQTLVRQYTTFSNPATLLGLDMMGRSMIAFKDNLVEVRNVRKEKGIVGKSVDMPKKFEKKEWHDRDQRGRWQGNKDKVYYGKSTWKSADQKAQEEYELKAASI